MQAVKNGEHTMESDKAGDKYLALRRYYFDILISPLPEIRFEWVRGRDASPALSIHVSESQERLDWRLSLGLKYNLNLFLNWAQYFF